VTGLRLCIVGLGLIGGSLALALRRARPAWRLSGVDADAATRAQALAAGAVEEATELAQARLDECDAVVLAVPAPALLELIPQAAARRALPWRRTRR
jgi:prephenate dehydrogenase